NLWRASTGGLQRLPGTSPAGKEEFLPLAEGEASITALFEDREGSLWIGTARSGLFRLNDGDFLLWGMREGLSSSSARTVFQDHEGALWIGTDGGGLNRLFDGRVTHYSAADGLPRDVVLAVYESSPGTLWIGTAGGGLSRFEDGRFTTFSTADGLSSAAVTCLFADRQQSLWIGTAGGLNRMRRGQLETFTTGDGLSSDIIRALLQDREGDLWIGTDAGLNRFRNGQITSFSTRDGLASDQILALHEDRDGILWIGTDAGLSRRTETGFVSYTRRQSLFNEGLRQILDDREGRLWLCSNDGLLSLSKGSLEEVRAGSGRRPDAEPLLSARNLGCSGYNQPAAWQGEGGKLYFATDSGVLELTPEELVPPPAPPVVLERILLGNRPVPPDGALRLPAGSRDVEFHYTGLALFRAAQVRFRYRLEPFDGEWIDAGTRRSARYTNLPTGSFVFRVAASAGGPWSPDEAVVRFEVPKPWYRTQAALWVGLLL
ncbi:MAG: hypothetical protein KDD47_28375, partial [Acidobacteria bacterium]|nr:hypothetical protein [Acidobacteriota bacterium]